MSTLPSTALETPSADPSEQGISVLEAIVVILVASIITSLLNSMLISTRRLHDTISFASNSEEQLFYSEKQLERIFASVVPIPTGDADAVIFEGQGQRLSASALNPLPKASGIEPVQLLITPDAENTGASVRYSAGPDEYVLTFPGLANARFLYLHKESISAPSWPADTPDNKNPSAAVVETQHLPRAVLLVGDTRLGATTYVFRLGSPVAK